MGVNLCLQCGWSLSRHHNKSPSMRNRMMEICAPQIFDGHSRAPVRIHVHRRSRLTAIGITSVSVPGSRSPDRARSLKVTQTILDVMTTRDSGVVGLYVALLRWVTTIWYFLSLRESRLGVGQPHVPIKLGRCCCSGFCPHAATSRSLIVFATASPRFRPDSLALSLVLQYNYL